MMINRDDYIERVIRQGDEGSALLARLTAPTLRNSQYVEVLEDGMNGLAVLRIPEGMQVVGHSAAGQSWEYEPAAHARSMVNKLVEQAREEGLRPVAFANVVDSATGDIGLLTDIGTALREAADHHGVAILNGENAILGNRITRGANVSGTMASIASGHPSKLPIWRKADTAYACFDPKGLPVTMNSDGVGTKTEFYERQWETHGLSGALYDSLAMKLDDAAKHGATARIVADVIELSSLQNVVSLYDRAQAIGEQMGFAYILQGVAAADRLQGYRQGVLTMNVSGSVISTVDEHRLRNPLAPEEGNTLLAIRGKSNPRSNGITAKRRIMTEQFGVEWHRTPEGRLFLPYLAEPSTVLYPVFSTLIDEGLATSVYHLSGGAYDGKLARPLAKHGLFAAVQDLFPPAWQDHFFAGATFAPAETCYAKWPMGTDGFITTRNSEEALERIQRHGLEGRIVGTIQAATNGRTGVELVGIKGSNGENVYYSGKAA